MPDNSLYLSATWRPGTLLFSGKYIKFHFLPFYYCIPFYRNQRKTREMIVWLNKCQFSYSLVRRNTVLYEEKLYQAVIQDQFLLLVEYVLSHWQNLIQFFKVEKQLKAFPIKSVPTVADFRTRSLGNLNGYVPIILYLNLLLHSKDRYSVLESSNVCSASFLGSLRCWS